MSQQAGWYPDPAQPATVRWWDGSGWTEHTRVHPQPAAAQPTPGGEVPRLAPLEPAMASGVPQLAPLEPAHVPDVPRLAPVERPLTRPPSVTAPVVAAPVVLATHRSPPLVPPPPVIPSAPPPPPPPVPVVVAAPLASDVGAGERGPTTITPTTRGRGGVPRSWGRPVLVTLTAVALAAGGWLGYQRVAAAGAANGPLTASQTAAVLTTFKPAAAVLHDGATARLVPRGDQVAGTGTLGGWCGAPSATDKHRVARRPWEIYQGGRATGVSVEAVAYHSPTEASAAVREFRAVSTRCHGTVQHLAAATLITSAMRSGQFTPRAPGATGFLCVLSAVGTTRAGQGVHAFLSASVQQRGRFVTIVWGTRTSPYTAGALDAVQALADAEVAPLAQAPTS